MQIKFVDLAAQNCEVSERIERELALIHESSSYIGGEQVSAFEREFAAFLGMKRVVGVASGTDALRLALLALGIGSGDEVVTVPMTFIATVAAIVQTGARPVFVDIDRDTCNISPCALRQYLESRTSEQRRSVRALVPVDLYGQPAPLPELREIAAEFGLKIVEDACQAHGSRLRNGHGWVRAGLLADVACFSFYPGKNLGAWGDAGAAATNDDEIANRISSLGNHGRISHYAHELCGYNARLDAVQAAVLRAKLDKLDEWNNRRRGRAAAYRELLSNLDVAPVREPWDTESNYHLFVIRTGYRDAIRNALLAEHVECGIHYPVPLHLQPALKMLGYKQGDFPVSEWVSDTVLSLPMHPHLTHPEIAKVVDVIGEVLDRKQEPSLVPEHASLQVRHTDVADQ